MRSKLLNDGVQRTYAVIFETDDEVASELSAFAKKSRLAASQFTAIGALSEVALENGEPKVHAHIVVGKRDGSAWGGHLLSARVRPTLEVVLVESPEPLRKRFDPESGLALIRVD